MVGFVGAVAVWAPKPLAASALFKRVRKKCGKCGFCGKSRHSDTSARGRRRMEFV